MQIRRLHAKQSLSALSRVLRKVNPEIHVLRLISYLSSRHCVINLFANMQISNIVSRKKAFECKVFVKHELHSSVWFDDVHWKIRKANTRTISWAMSRVKSFWGWCSTQTHKKEHCKWKSAKFKVPNEAKASYECQSFSS